MNITGVHPQDFRLDSRTKRKRVQPRVDNKASTSFESHNYYSVLSDTESETETAEPTPPPATQKERIPPIVIYSYLSNHSQTLKGLNDKLSCPVVVKTKPNRLLLYTKTVPDYELLLREIKTADLAYHTYPLPNKHQPRVALKGIPPNVSLEEITEELSQRKLQVINIRQITRRDKTTDQIIQKYPIFIITFREGTNLREVNKINNLCHCIIRWEKYRATRPIQQCFNCQQFGHSSAFCGRPAQCVKCDKSHQTQQCTKRPTDPPKCINCGGEHPANYSGCPTIKKILDSRKHKQPTHQHTHPQQPPTRAHFPPLRQPRNVQHHERTWAHVAAHTTGPPEDTSLPSLLGSLKSILTALNLQNIGVALRTLATRLTETRAPMDKMMLIVETLLTCFVTSP